MSNQIGRPPVKVSKEALKEAYEKTGSLQGTGQLLGIGANTVKRYMNQYGLKRKRVVIE